MAIMVTPESVAAIPMRAQVVTDPPGSTGAMMPPRAAPIMSRGAMIPPLVPEPSASDQMTSFTTRRRARLVTAKWPASSLPMVA